jgi:hypothetical protein
LSISRHLTPDAGINQSDYADEIISGCYRLKSIGLWLVPCIRWLRTTIIEITEATEVLFSVLSACSVVDLQY